MTGFPSRRAGAAYLAGQGVVDVNGNIQVVETPGKSDAGQPAWNTTIGQTTVDSSVTWINAGPGVWHPNTAYTIGQYILDSNGNLQRASSIAGNGQTFAQAPAFKQALNDSIVDGNVTWTCAGPSQAGLFYCNRNNRLQLRSVRTGNPPAESFDIATSMVEMVPMVRDQFGNYARWDQSSGLVFAGRDGSPG